MKLSTSPSSEISSLSSAMVDQNKNDNAAAVMVLTNEFSKCMTEIESSKNSIIRRNSLKQMQSLIQRLQLEQHQRLLIQVLQGGRYNCSTLCKEEQNPPLPSLSYLLLEIISDHESTELCRERAAICLKDCFKSLSSLLSKRDDSATAVFQKEYIHDFYIEYCSMMYSRFGFDKNGNCSDKQRRSTTRSFEDVEEIRLTLIQTMSDLLFFMERCVSVNNRNEKPLISATALICQIIAKSTFNDPYPELKRESCMLVKFLTRVFPKVIVMNEESLLNSIVGGSQNAYQSTSNCLIRHRHAKTRSLALETIVEIMNCHSQMDAHLSTMLKGEGAETEETKDEDTNTIGKSSLEERLMSHVLQNLELSVPFDNSASVRVALVTTIGKLLQVILLHPTSYSSFEKISDLSSSSIPRLLVLLLMGISDQVDVVKRTGLNYLNKCAKIWMRSTRSGTKGSGIDDDSEDDILDTEQLSIKASENKTTGNQYNNCIPYFIEMAGYETVMILLERISNNISIKSSKHYLDALSCVIELLTYDQNDKTYDVTPWRNNLMTKIVTVLCNVLSESEDEESIFHAASNCARSLGLKNETRNAAFELVETALLSGDINEDLSNDNELLFADRVGMPTTELNPLIIVSSPHQCASIVNFIGGLIKGWHASCSSNIVNFTIDQLKEEIGRMSTSLTRQKVQESVHSSNTAALALLSACYALVNFISYTNNKADLHEWCDKSNDIVRNITWCSVILLGCPKTYNTTETSVKLLQSFSTSLCGIKSDTELLDINFTFMLKNLINGFEKDSWDSGDQNLQIFDALIRMSGGQTVGEHFDLLLPILERFLTKDSADNNQTKEQVAAAFSTKIFFMALVESIVSNKSFPKHSIHLFAERLLLVTVIPNLVWQVGGMASALRKVSAAVLFAILQGDCTTDLIMYKISPQLLPILKSSLSDDDTSLRELVISCMVTVFEKIPGALGEEAIHQLYPDLMKCLDDSSENVRYIACDALKPFLKCAPVSHYHGTAINYMVEYLFIHLDDPDPCFKEKIYHVLVVALDIDSNEVIKGAEKSLLSHSNRYYCDLILKCASEKIRLQKVMLSN